MKIKQIWGHCREIQVDAFKHKIIYNIPIYGYKEVYDNFSIEIKQNENEGYIRLISFREPLYNPMNESERELK